LTRKSCTKASARAYSRRLAAWMTQEEGPADARAGAEGRGGAAGLGADAALGADFGLAAGGAFGLGAAALDTGFGLVAGDVLGLGVETALGVGLGLTGGGVFSTGARAGSDMGPDLVVAGVSKNSGGGSSCSNDGVSCSGSPYSGNVDTEGSTGGSDTGAA